MKHTSFYLLADKQPYNSLSSAVHKALDDMQANGVYVLQGE